MKIKFLKITKNKLDLIREWRMHPEVTKYMSTDPKISKEDQKNWFKKIENDSTKKYWIVNVDGKDVGVVNLTDIDPQNKKTYWAYYLGEISARGKGIGKQIELNIMHYVFEKMKFNKLCGEILEFNKFVVDIHKKYGSKIDGVLREHIYKNGKFYDLITMSILKKEYNNIKKKLPLIKAKIQD